MSTLDSRRRCLEEVCGTEKTYVQDLNYIVEEWLKPLRASEIIPRGQLPDIFSNIELILSVNSELNDKLNKCLTSFPEGTPGEKITGFGEIFESQSRLLVCYHQYCSNHSNALAAVAQARKQSSKFEAFVQEKEGTGLSLGSYLIKPVQRICKYPLLFRELLKFTPNDHPDHEPLENAFRVLNDVTLQINEIKRQAENLSKLHDIAHQISGFPGNIVDEDRVFVKEGTMDKINPKKKVQERYFFLFSDIIVWCEKGGVKKKVCSYRGQLSMDSTLVKQPDPVRDKAPKGLIPGNLLPLSFQLVQMAKQKVYTLVARDEKEMKEWMSACENVISGHLEQLQSDHSHQKLVVPQKSSSKVRLARQQTDVSGAIGSYSSSNISMKGGIDKDEEDDEGLDAYERLEKKNAELERRLKKTTEILEAAIAEKSSLEAKMEAIIHRMEKIEGNHSSDYAI